jgi:hypothetical protein
MGGIVMNTQNERQGLMKDGLDNMNKKSYQKPMLRCYRDVRTLTLGTSPGPRESDVNAGPLARIGAQAGDGPVSDTYNEEANSDVFEG